MENELEIKIKELEDKISYFVKTIKNLIVVHHLEDYTEFDEENQEVIWKIIWCE